VVNLIKDIMNLQYISDNLGNKTAVIIPISDWDLLTKQYKITVKENINNDTNDIPDWHKKIIDKRLKEYLENPTDVIDFDEFCKEIENEL
jgi:hypothetical protein